MTTALAVLVAVVIGGGYIFWRVSQTQYYVAANSNGAVVIYRGINYRILGISLYSLYKPTGIQLSQVPETYQQTVTNPDGYGQPVTRLRRRRATSRRPSISACSAYAAQKTWVTADETTYTKYQAKVAAARKKHPPGSVANLGPPPPNPGPPPLAAGQRPSSTGGVCQPSEAYGIPASALNPAPPGSS